MEQPLYHGLMDVLTDDKFPEIDYMLRQGRHIGQEDITSHSFLNATFHLLSPFYRKYSCELVHADLDVADYFFLSSYGTLFGQRKLQPAEMIVGMTLAYLITTPEFITPEVEFERLVSTLRLLLTEENFMARMAGIRKRGRNSEGDEDKARKNIGTILRRLETLGFVSFGRGKDVIKILSPIRRFLDPVRGVGSLEENIRVLVNRGLLEDAVEEQEGEGDEEA